MVFRLRLNPNRWLWPLVLSLLAGAVSAAPRGKYQPPKPTPDEPAAAARDEATTDEAVAQRLFQRGMDKLEAGEVNDALERFEDVVEDHPRSSVAGEAHYQRGTIFSRRHQFEKALGEYTAILSRYPGYGGFNQVVEDLYSMGNRILEGERPRYFGVIPGFKDRRTGVDIMAAVVRYAPFSELAPQALMGMAELYEKVDSPEEAIGALDRLINNYPRSVQTADAYLRLAQLYREFVQGPEYDQAATRESIRYYEDFLILFERSPRTEEAQQGLQEMRDTLSRSKYLLGEFYWFYRNLDEAALIFLNESITIAPDSATAQEAQDLIARIESGEEPPKTPADWVFGRYQHPRQYILERPGMEDEGETDADENGAP